MDDPPECTDFDERLCRRAVPGAIEVIAIIHPRERAAKCSLRALRGRPDLRFVPLRRAREVAPSGALILSVEGPPLSPADCGRPLIVLDGTWRHVEGMLAEFPLLERRSLPGFASAYPRRTKVFRDPDGGLASAEAIFAATALLGRPDPSWLDGYPWRAAFLKANVARIRKGAGEGGRSGARMTAGPGA